VVRRKKSPYLSLVERLLRRLQRNYFRQSNRILGTLDIKDVLSLSFRFLISVLHAGVRRGLRPKGCHETRETSCSRGLPDHACDSYTLTFHRLNVYERVEN